MSAANPPVDFPVMASREETSKQVNVRLKQSMIDEVDKFRLANEFQPTWTQVVEAALRDWLVKRRAERKPEQKQTEPKRR
jgi:metal-responsive CopG/Arc/MetJ family transcriptional regulator